jgi:hypothetical protein
MEGLFPVLLLINVADSGSCTCWFLDSLVAETAERRLLGTKPKRWRKHADTPLATHLERQNEGFTSNDGPRGGGPC